jgi:hypothetical protein
MVSNRFAVGQLCCSYRLVYKDQALNLGEELMKPLNVGLAHKCIRCQDVLMTSTTAFCRFQSLLQAMRRTSFFAE